MLIAIYQYTHYCTLVFYVSSTIKHLPFDIWVVSTQTKASLRKDIFKKIIGYCYCRDCRGHCMQCTFKQILHEPATTPGRAISGYDAMIPAKSQ